jgi:hypothetical protein
VILLFQNEQYAVGMVFLPKKKNKLIFKDDFETAIQSKFEYYRMERSVDVSNLGQIAAEKNR